MSATTYGFGIASPWEFRRPLGNDACSKSSRFYTVPMHKKLYHLVRPLLRVVGIFRYPGETPALLELKLMREGCIFGLNTVQVVSRGSFPSSVTVRDHPKSVIRLLVTSSRSSRLSSFIFGALWLVSVKLDHPALYAVCWITINNESTGLNGI